MSETPQIITLDNSNSVQIILQFVDVAQKAGTFLLSEADILKRCRDVLLSNATDPEINVVQAKQLIVQAVIKGQSKGCFTLDDASILHKVCQYISTTLTGNSPPHPVPVPSVPSAPSVSSVSSVSSGSSSSTSISSSSSTTSSTEVAVDSTAAVNG